MIDLTIPLYTILVIEILIVAMVSVVGYFILRTTIRGLRHLVATMQTRKAPEIHMGNPRIAPGGA